MPTAPPPKAAGGQSGTTVLTPHSPNTSGNDSELLHGASGTHGKYDETFGFVVFTHSVTILQRTLQHSTAGTPHRSHVPGFSLLPCETDEYSVSCYLGELELGT